MKKELLNFIDKNNCDYTKNLINIETLKQIEKELNIEFGKQLTNYLLKFGYLGFEEIELYGINSSQGLDSDMIKQTKYLHQYFEKTIPFVAIGHFDETHYSCVDDKDIVYEYNCKTNEMTNLKITLDEYILTKFKKKSNITNDKTMEELEQLVVQNNTEAIYELGNEYFIGKQVQKDYYKAISLFKKAENLGNTKGKYGLAKCYYYGRGVEKDYEKAYNMFYELMTKNKDIEAKYYVGLMYYWGDFVKRDYKKAFNIFKDLYEKANDKYALMMLPGMYYYGQGTEVDFEKTRQLGEIALENSDDKYISYYLGEIYYYGKGINKNYKKAKTYFEKSIDDTDDGAYYYLGLIYQEGGDGINKDEEKSKRYFHKVEHDFCTAITYYILAVYDEKENQLNDWMEMLSYDRNTLSKIINLLPKGHPCIRDYKKLNSLKDEQYNRIANIVKEKIQSYYSKKTIITIQVAENEEEVNILSDVMILSYEYESIQSYFEDMCKRDDKKILYLVGKMYYYGAGCEKNTNLGLKYLKRSASQGYAYAQYELAVISYDCNNFVETEHYLSNILEGEDTYLASLANNLVGQMYYFGHGVEKNFEKAYNYYRNSAEKNYSHAQLALGLAYLWGEGTTQDIDKAIYWLEESAKRNNSNAQCALGYLYYYGQDEGFNIPINKEYAIELLTKAANNGNKKAQTELEKIKNQTHYNKTRDNN